jgi:gas vesicle protein
MSEHDDKNALVYLLAGFGLGALIGAAAGLLFAPKPGTEMRDELASKAKELKGKTQEWIAEQKAKRAAQLPPVEEAGA